MDPVESYLLQTLREREEAHTLRKLKVRPEGFTDFSSNDFLGFAHTRKLDEKIAPLLKEWKEPLSGAGGSRLITGNTIYTETLETFLAGFYQAEAALLFNSGYDANLGLLSCIATRHDTILYDELCHASIIDGIRLSQAGKKFKFRHNDLADLQKKMQQAGGNIFVVVETVYSMDGDLAPLKELTTICKASNAALIVDEAHATGVFGTNGEGLGVSQQVAKDIFARVHTFGKALGCHGAVVTGSNLLKNYLLNFARSFIYTTALPQHNLLTIHVAHELLQAEQTEKEKLWSLIRYFETKVKAFDSPFRLISGKSAIQSIITGDKLITKKISEQLQAAQLDVRPILSPTVAAGTERLRVCLHSFNTQKEIDRLFEVLGSCTGI